MKDDFLPVKKLKKRQKIDREKSKIAREKYKKNRKWLSRATFLSRGRKITLLKYVVLISCEEKGTIKRSKVLDPIRVINVLGFFFAMT